MARIVSFIVLLSSVLFSAAPSMLHSSLSLQSPPPGWGAVLTSYDGENVYSNGSDFSYIGPDSSTGTEYQCVELVQRYFAHKWHIQPNGSTNNFKWPNVPTASAMFNNFPSGVEAHQNGDSSALPKPGDALIFAKAKGWSSGHVALITNVSDTHVEFVQQNIAGRATDSLPINSQGTIDAGRHYPQVRGWLHAVANSGFSSSRHIDRKNTTYNITCDGEIKSGFDVTLADGAVTVPNPDDANRSFSVKYEAEADGDLTGDGRPETAVLLFCSPQPSNYYLEEVQVFGSGNKLLGELPSPNSINSSGVLPPQYVPSELTIDSGNISAGMMFYGPNDSHASGPSEHRTVVWHWDGQSFTRVS